MTNEGDRLLPVSEHLTLILQLAIDSSDRMKTGVKLRKSVSLFPSLDIRLFARPPPPLFLSLSLYFSAAVLSLYTSQLD